MGPLREYRNSLIFGQGLDAGFTTDGKLFVGNPTASVPVNLAVEFIDLKLTVEPRGDQSVVTLVAFSVDGTQAARISRDNIATKSLAGNLALVANFGGAGGQNAAKKGKKAKENASDSGAGKFWFADWEVLATVSCRMKSAPLARFSSTITH
jgi:hypothetical protein